MGNDISALVSKQEAEQIIARKGNIPWSSKKKILRTELLYLPVYVFTVTTLDSHGVSASELLIVDGIKGEFAIYKRSPSAEEGNLFPGGLPQFRLDMDSAKQSAVSEYGRWIYRHNLRNPNKVNIESISDGEQFYYPYWISYFSRRKGFDFEAVDAVGGEIQGVRMKPVFMDLILSLARKATD
jgi:hypothetical protein